MTARYRDGFSVGFEGLVRPFGRRAYGAAGAVCLAVALSIAPAPAAAGAAVAQEAADPDPDPLPLPDVPEARALPEFLEAFDSGRYEALSDFFREHLADPEGDGDENPVAGAASYWLSVYHELGPVDLESIERDDPPPLFWVRGEVTGGWAGFRFWTDSIGRIEGFGVMRGVRPAGVPSSPAVDPRELPERLARYFDALAAHDLYSGAAVVARNGVPIFEGAWGWADRDLRVPNRPDTRFDIASVTKTFTAVAIAQLAGRGVLSLDEPVERWLPELPDHVGEVVTIRHLLTHTSGIELDDHAPFNEAVTRAGSVEELLAAQLEFLPHLNRGNYEDFRPLEEFDYTNEGFDLLGAIVERASGRPWDSYLHEEVFASAGMFSTGVDYRGSVPEVATRYTARFPGFRGERRVVPGEFTLQARPSGGAYSTVGDLLRYAVALSDGTLIEPAWWERLAAMHVTALERPPSLIGYGYGFEVERTAGVLQVGHAGGSSGVSARFDLYPELGYTVILLSNYDRATRHVADHIRDLISDL